MCGIAGWLTHGVTPDRPDLERMASRLVHRGPDAGGVSVDGPMGLVHRRLSVIDTAEAANQPMDSRCGRFRIVFNGEIYNFRELRAELECRGHGFRTASDTEVLLAAVSEWGEGALERLNGMFALALWDAREQVLFLARDRAGEKPLHYAQTPQGFLFASELRALTVHPAVGRRLDPAGLVRFLAMNYVSGAGTLCTGVKRLPPACVLTVRPGGQPVVRRYWDLAAKFRHKPRWPSEDEAAEALRALLDDATRLRLVSDVPLGAFLSGGVDSATVVAAMRRSGAEVRTFSVGFAEAGFDEVEEARRTARHLGGDHSDRRVALSPAEMARAITHAADDPLADNSCVPSWELAAFARESITVALTGDGGDELFGGYETYAADRLAAPLRHVPAAFWHAAYGGVDRLLPNTFSKVGWEYKLRHLLKGLSLGWPRAHFAWRTIFDQAERLALLRPEVTQAVAAEDVFSEFHQAWDETDGCDDLDRAMYVDIKTWMVDDVLVKVDRMTMAHGLESRAPFLDHRVMEFAAGLPAEWKLKGFKKKYLLKRSQEQFLPQDVLCRRKLGFNAPMSHWLVGDLREFCAEALGNTNLDNFLRRDEIDRIWAEHRKGKRDHGFKLFGLVCLSKWLDAP